MKNTFSLMCAAAFAAVTAVAAPVCTVSQGVWCESAVGDAGSLPITSQATMGTGALNAIIGNIGNGTGGSDLYSILITNPAQFSASLAAYTATGATGENNAALYLFSAQGFGVEAANEGASLTGFNGAAGVYYIDVVPDGNSPEFTSQGTASSVFAPLVNGQISLPVSGAGIIDRYSLNGCGANCQGEYQISLTDAQYSNVPEPTSLALLGSALSVFGLVFQSRRKKNQTL